MIKLSVVDTLLSTVPLIFTVFIFWQQLHQTKIVLIAIARMVLQLLAVGYLLTFLFQYDLPWLGVLILLMMTTVAASITIRPLKNKSRKHFYCALSALLIAGGVHLIWVVAVVLRLDPWYQPQYVISLAGMIFANAMNTLSIGAERYESELSEGKTDALTRAFNAASIPVINSLLAVGLVSLPGMMTGQILSGVSPLDAVRYQILIMSVILGSSIMGLIIYFYLLKKDQNSPYK